MKLVLRWLAIATLTLGVSGYTGSTGVWATKSGTFTAKPFTGDSTGVKNALAYVSAGGRVRVYPGAMTFQSKLNVPAGVEMTWDAGTFTFLSGSGFTIAAGKVKLLGAGLRSTKFTYTGTGDFITLGVNDGNHSGVPNAYDGTGSQVLIQDLWLDGPGSGTTARAIVDWDSGSNDYVRLTIGSWGVGYFGIGADISHFTRVYWSGNGTGTHLGSRSDQNTFDHCYWTGNAIGLLDEFAYHPTLFSPECVFQTTADIILDCPASATSGGDVRTEYVFDIFGGWFESPSSPTLHRHIWVGRGGTSTRRADGLFISGAEFFCSGTDHLLEIDAGNQIRMIGVKQIGVINTSVVLMNSVASVFPEISIAQSSFAQASTLPIFSGAGVSASAEFVSGTRMTNSIASGASITVNASGSEIVEPGALTQNLTVNTPTMPMRGKILRFIFLQDGTGGRTVTWSAAFKVIWSDTGNTANKRSSIEFYYNGANWVQLGAQSPYF